MTSDRCAARISDVVNNATVAPPAFSSATAAATAWSIDPSEGYSWSNPCARERNPSSSREKTRGCERRASVSTAAANGSRTGLISASPELPAPGISASLCHPGFSPSLSSAARTASQAWARTEFSTPRTRLTINSSVYSARGSIMIASIRSSVRRHAGTQHQRVVTGGQAAAHRAAECLPDGAQRLWDGGQRGSTGRVEVA